MKELKNFILKNIPIQVSIGKVVSINNPKRTCTVEREDLPTLYDVQLQPIVQLNKGFYICPKLNSYVLVGIIENKHNHAFILSFSEIEEIHLGDSVNEGIVKIQPLKTELQKLNGNIDILKNATQAIASALDALIPGTSIAFQTAVSAMSTQNLSNLENTKVKH